MKEAYKIVRKLIVRMRMFKNVFEKVQMFENKLQMFENKWRLFE